MRVLLNEPYRIFFPIGWLMGLVGVTYWLMVSAGATGGYHPLFHGLIQIELFGSAFAVGFLLTALPKFLGTRSSSPAELISLIVVYLALAAAILTGAFAISQWLYLALIGLVVRFALIRLRARKSAPPYSFALVGFGLLEGALGAWFLNSPVVQFPLLGQKLLEQGLLLSLSLGIGSFLGPRLMGVVDTKNAVVSLPGRRRGDASLVNSPLLAVIAIGAAIFLSFFIETGWNRSAGIYLRAAASLCCLARFSVLQLPRSRSLAGIFVACSLWSMVMGIFLAGALPSHEVAMLHLTYLGGFAALILSIGAQVASSHAGVARFWPARVKVSSSIAALVVVSILLRLSTGFFPTEYLFIIGSAALLFDLAMLLWGWEVLRFMGRVPIQTPLTRDASRTAV